MFRRLALLAAVAIAAGCTSGDGPRVAPSHLADAHAQSLPDGGTGLAALPAPARGFAKLPDRGDLLAYPGGIVRQDGAYTWHRAELSEEHALRAIAGGRLRVTTPEGEVLDFQYDRHVEHATGDWTWIGHRPGHEGEQTILTFGAQAAFGSIAQPGKPPLRLVVRDGASWLVETDPVKVAAIVNAATRPKRPDYHIVAESELPRRAPGVVAAADGASSAPATGTTGSATAASAATTVDLVIGYTAGFASAQGGTSAATTRLNYLVDVANAAYGNSKVDAQVRLVKAMQVNYTDTNSNDTALEQLSGYKSGSGPVTPNAAFDALRAAREQYGADLVSLVRDFRDPEQDGCGLAWLLGGGLQGIGAGEGWDELGYSVVGDGIDAGTDGKNYYCLDETLAHEMGHNMGAAHDRETAKGDDGVLDNPDDYGAYAYSFGYKAGSTAGNFYTVMAYGDTGQTIYRVFSNPGITFCGGHPCGVANQADNARTLRQTAPAVAQFRMGSQASLGSDLAPGIASSDINGDGYDDLFFRNGGQFVYWLMHGKARLGWKQYTVKADTAFAGYGDFDGNGKADLVWIDASRNVFMWLGNGSGFTYKLTHTHGAEWTLAGVADINGDRRDDLLWYSPQLQQLVVWYMNGFTRTGYRVFAVPAGYHFAGSGDFNGDGKGDLLWDNAARDLYMWIGSGTSFSSTYLRTYQSGWNLIGTRDINGDGRSDLQWRNQSSSEVTYWLMNGTALDFYRLFNIDPGLRSQGAGDLNGDGFADLIWRNDARELYISFGDGYGFTTIYVATNTVGWSVLN
jgi:hypothetical protein